MLHLGTRLPREQEHYVPTTLVETDWQVFRFLKILSLDGRDEQSRAIDFQRSYRDSSFSANDLDGSSFRLWVKCRNGPMT
jgi:hypothetical protein